MKTSNDEELNSWKKEEHTLIRQLDVGMINEKQFQEQVIPLRTKIMDRIKNFLANINEQPTVEKPIVDSNKIEPTEVESQMAEKVKQEIKEKKFDGRSQKDSINTAIVEVLQKKSIKTANAAAEELVKMKPELNLSKAKTKIKTMIWKTKKGIGRWANYKWDEQAFQLIPKL